jgi:hypothetical protein
MSNTMKFTGNKTDCAEYVSAQVQILEPDSLSIMIMGRGKYEGYFVSGATNTSLEDIVEKMGRACYTQLWNI